MDTFERNQRALEILKPYYSFRKLYFVCDCFKCRIKTIAELRKFAEEFYRIIDYSISDYGMNFYLSNGKRSKAKAYKYTKNKVEKFDDLDFENLFLASFKTYPKKKPQIFLDILSMLLISPNNDNGFSIMCSFKPVSEETDFLELIKKIKHLISSKFIIINFFADTLECYKHPESFMMGILPGKEVCSTFEREIAHSIGLSLLVHHKLPYLFAYNYFFSPQPIEGIEITETVKQGYYYELFFPELLEKNFTEYSYSKSWENFYELLTKKEMIKKEVFVID
jgi:hypothetical protein